MPVASPKWNLPRAVKTFSFPSRSPSIVMPTLLDFTSTSQVASGG
jgi:hypothetical protein